MPPIRTLGDVEHSNRATETSPVFAVFIVQDPDESIYGKAIQDQRSKASGAGKREECLDRRVFHGEIQRPNVKMELLGQEQIAVEVSVLEPQLSRSDGQCKVVEREGCRKAFNISQICDLPSRASIRSKAVTRSSLWPSPSSSLTLSRKPEALSRQPSFKAKPFHILF